jgi:TRAP-type uncharacterized transport system substrate-binding protein
MYKIYQKYILIFFILLIILYIVNKYVFIKKIKEHYLTYFLPFNTDSDNIDLSNFYNNNENNLNYFKHNLDYNIIKLGMIELDKYFTENIIKSYLEKSNLVKAISINYDTSIDSLDNLIDNNVNFIYSDYTTIHYYRYNLKKDINNIRLVTHLYKVYTYIFVKKSSNITSLNNLPYNFKLGISAYPDPNYFYYNYLLSSIGYIENEYYNTTTYDNINYLFDDLANSTLDVIIIRDTFPSNNLSNILNKTIYNDIILLPFDIDNEKTFFKKNDILFLDYIDLNKLSNIYLPKKFGVYEYNINLPTIKILYTYKILLSNYNTDYKYTNNFIKYYINNYKQLNNILLNQGYNLEPITFYKITIIPYHYGVISYLKKIGYITFTDNENCKYLVGKMECNEDNLKKNNLFL